MSRRANKYEAAGDADALDDLSRRLAGDLRKHVHALESQPFSSPGWLKLVDSLKHVAQVATMEHKIPREGDQTLWEGDELTVRFLLEEGKLNLCLRLMENYCKEKPPPDERSRWLEQKAAALSNSPNADELDVRMRDFEASLGTLLRCSFEHIEAVQTVDLVCLFDHIAGVLQSAAPLPNNATFDKMQEADVLRYAASVLERLEALGEERLMPHVERSGLVPLVVRHLVTFGPLLSRDDKVAGCLCLAFAIDTEAFETDSSTYVRGVEGLLASDGFDVILQAAIDARGKPKLRPLLDLVVSLRR